MKTSNYVPAKTQQFYFPQVIERAVLIAENQHLVDFFKLLTAYKWAALFSCESIAVLHALKLQSQAEHQCFEISAAGGLT